jgi:nucleotide-binding universal stress UspA family protein
MRTNILLAIDNPTGNPSHLKAEAGMTGELIRDHADHVIVLHVQEFSIPRLARNMVDHGGRQGRLAVDATVADLRAAGIQTSGIVREADFGHVARTIVDAADEFDARVIVLGAPRQADSPRLPLGGVASHVLHITTRPVLTVPHAYYRRDQPHRRMAVRT